MNIDLKGLKIAIIGGNSPCKEILEILMGPGLKELEIEILMVADTLTQVEGIKYAQKKGVLTTIDYQEVCALSGIDIILKLKNDEILSCILDKVNTEHVSIIDLDAYRAR
ncbi:MAG: PAS domain-containing sensor histidine kinase, partial [Deltaproteobacteria bacterium]